MWLLNKLTEKRVEAAQKSEAYANTELRSQFEAKLSDTSAVEGLDNKPGGGVAQIDVKGLLTVKKSFLAWLLDLDNTTYSEISGAIAEADVDENIERIELHIDSPGGIIDGLFDTLAVIQAANKPIKAVVSNVAASAAYAIASQAEQIIVTNHAVMLGSIGIAKTYRVSEDIVEIASTKAPKKRPDVTTEKGKAIVREELDAFHQIFVEAIAAGRATSVENVNANYGQGAVLLAREALKRGMIDSVLSDSNTINVKAVVQDGGKLETNKMDLKEFKAEHPAVYKEAVAEGEKQGVAQEKDRVNAHLEMGKPSGDFTIAHEAIANGSGMTQTLMSKYMMAAVNAKDINDRQEDDQAASGADGVTEAQTGEDTVEEQAADLVAKKRGVPTSKAVQNV